MRLGLFGGTFDPVHFGHLLLAECCREQCRLDAVWFLPTAVPPHKQDRPPTPAELRIEMLELATAGNEAMAVSRYEADRGGVNYTAQTLEHFHQEDPQRELFFLLGADMLRDLPHWREPGRICGWPCPWRCVVRARRRWILARLPNLCRQSESSRSATIKSRCRRSAFQAPRSGVASPRG